MKRLLLALALVLTAAACDPLEATHTIVTTPSSGATTSTIPAQPPTTVVEPTEPPVTTTTSTTPELPATTTTTVPEDDDIGRPPSTTTLVEYPTTSVPSTTTTEPAPTWGEPVVLPLPEDWFISSPCHGTYDGQCLATEQMGHDGLWHEIIYEPTPYPGWPAPPSAEN